MSADIFTRIRDDMSGSKTAFDLTDTIRAVSIALDDEREYRSQFEQTAANPLVETVEAERAGEEIAKSLLKEQRLVNALALLKPKRDETAEAERQAKLRIEYEAARTERDAIVAEVRKAWPKAATTLVNLVQKIEAFEDKVPGVVTPVGFSDLMGADGILNADPQRSLAAHLRIPLVTLTDAPAWDYETEAARAAERAEMDARHSTDQAMTKQIVAGANLRRYGTNDPELVASKQREEAEAQRKFFAERERTARPAFGGQR